MYILQTTIPDIQTCDLQRRMQPYEPKDRLGSLFPHPPQLKRICLDSLRDRYLILCSASNEMAALKAQIAELYKTQNTHLQTIKSLEMGLTAVQEAEKLLKQESSLLSTFVEVHLLTSDYPIYERDGKTWS